MRTRSSQQAAQQDELWSLASTLSRLQSSVKGTYFENFVSSGKRCDVAVSATTGAAVDLLDVPIEALSANALPQVTRLLVFEQLSGTIVSLDKLGENLSIWVARQSFDHDPSCGVSLVRQIHEDFVDKSVEQQRALGLSQHCKGACSAKCGCEKRRVSQLAESLGCNEGSGLSDVGEGESCVGSTSRQKNRHEAY